MKLSACKRLPLRPVSATWYRAIAPRYWEMAFKTDYTAQVTTRFNPGTAAKTPFEIFYLAENQSVALYEVGALFGPTDRPIANPHQTNFLPIDVSVDLQSVADLTDTAQQGMLDVSAQELTGDWDTYPAGEAPTQRLGAALFATKNVEGFLAISAKMPRCRTLIVFPEKLRVGSQLVFHDTITNKDHRIGP
jgi:RES domain-containing protein